jgi:3-hydroxyacyl-CoA dehydrogenase
MSANSPSNDFITSFFPFQRTLGLRFLYPVYYIPEVEITPNKYTSAVAIEKGRCSLPPLLGG